MSHIAWHNNNTILFCLLWQFFFNESREQSYCSGGRIPPHKLNDVLLNKKSLHRCVQNAHRLQRLRRNTRSMHKSWRLQTVCRTICYYLLTFHQYQWKLYTFYWKKWSKYHIVIYCLQFFVENRAGENCILVIRTFK